jgi:hypothetical protein
MTEVPTLVTSCISCFTPGNLSATLAVILIGAGLHGRLSGGSLLVFVQTSNRTKKPPEGGFSIQTIDS